MADSEIRVKGAREHNLKNVSLRIPRDKLIVFTGLSGSGKSSLAFDTLYAEGQRRYMESLSSYARQFLGMMEKPDVDSIDGLSPAISIDQKTTSKNPRSTVGTVTEIYDYLRLLYARIGVPHCPVCGNPIRQQTLDEIVDSILTLPEGTRIQLLAPIVRGRKGEYVKEFENARRAGFVRARVDGEQVDLADEIKLDKQKKHTIEIVVDRLVVKPDVRGRLSDSVETAVGLADGLLTVDVVGGEELKFSQNYACPEHGVSIEELTPRMFSFNNPFGACPTCTGLGMQYAIDPDLVLPDRSLSINEGAIRATGWSVKDGTIARMYFTGLAAHYGFSLDTPIKELPKKIVDIILYGNGKERFKVTRIGEYGHGEYSATFEGVIPNLQRRYEQTTSDWAKRELEVYMREIPCPTCGGKRLKPESLSVTVGDKNIVELTQLSVTDALAFLDTLKLSERDKLIAGRVLKEVRERLGFLNSVGLNYLTLSRRSGTLSGGESQRIRLATQIGSYLMGVLYILDEPSIGLHQRDNDKLLATLKHLRDLGNTLIVVEHDEDTMRAADWIVDVGPGAGVHGGEIVYSGPAAEIVNCERSVTGQYLSGKKRIPVPAKRRSGNGHLLTVRGAAENNLKHIDVSFKEGAFNVVTGVSGSGKSSLVNEILYKRLAADLNGASTHPGKHDSLEGLEFFDKVIDIDQRPTRAFSTISASCSRPRTMPKCAAIPQDVSLLTSRAADARRVRATAF